jgi:hypothetical protein
MFRSVASRRAAGTAWIAKGKEIERNNVIKREEKELLPKGKLHVQRA